MSNTIKIRRGSGVPQPGDFDSYELAYDYTGNDLYVKVGTNMVKVNSEGSGTVTNVVTENGISGGPITSTGTIGLNFSTLTYMSGDISGTTEFILQNGTVESRKAASEIKLTAFDATGFSIAGAVDTSGTPIAQEYARFTDANTIEGRSAAGVRTDLGLNIGTDVQAQDDLLQNIADFPTSSSSNDGKVVTYQDLDGTLVLSTPSPGTITGVTGMTDNNVLTASGSTTISGEGNLTFNGSTLGVIGEIDVSDIIHANGVANNRLTLADDSDSSQANQVTLTGGNNVNILIDNTNNGTGDFQVRARPTTANDLDTASMILDMDKVTAVFNQDTSQQFQIGGANRLKILETGAFLQNSSLGVGVTPLNGNARIQAASHIEAGVGSGAIGLTINDGGGNSNVTFNHTEKVPEQNGNSGRIEVNTDSSGGEYMAFELAGNVTSGVSVSTTEIARINSTGLQSSLSGTAASPALRVNDSDTGLYRIADNKLGISTAGTFAVAVDASQNVGIGTSSPSAKLEVEGNGAILDIDNDSSGTSYLRFLDSGSSKFALRHSIGSTYLGIFDYNSSSDALVVDQGGNVGIGTTSPSGKLGVESAVGQVGFNAGTSSSPERGNLYFTTDGTGWKFNIGKYQSSSFSSLMTFQDNGNVGIGTQSPAHEMVLRKDQSAETELSIVNLTSNASATTNLRFRNATSGSESGNGALIQLTNGNDFKILNQFGNNLIFGTNNAEKVRLASNGNLIVGSDYTTNASTKLVVSHSGPNGILLNNDASNTANSGRLFFEGTSTSAIFQEGNDLSFRTGATTGSGSGTERMLINSSGNVGIGELSPDRKLHITGSENELMCLESTDTNTDLIFADTGGSVRVRGASGNFDVYTGGTASSTSASGSTYAFRIESDGDFRLRTPEDKRVYIGDGNEFSIRHASAGYNLFDSSNGAFYLRNTISNQNIYFGINDGGTTAYPMTVHGASQNIGIGTTSPDSKLEVSSSGVTAVKITGSYPILHFEDADTGAYIANNADGLFIGKTNSPSSSNDIMKLDLINSRVGIGTGSPGNKLDVNGGITTNYGVAFTNGNTNFLQYNNSGEDVLYMRDTTNNAMVQTWGVNSVSIHRGMTINQDGGNYDTRILGDTNTHLLFTDASADRVGINASTPLAKLHVGGDSFFNGQLRGGFGAATTGGTADWNHSTNARSGNGNTLLLSTATNGPGTTAVNTLNTTYMHTLNFEYASYDGDANMTQIGIPYYFANLDGVRPVIRSRYSGTWSEWHSIPIANQNGSIQGSKGSASNPSYVFNQGSEISEPDTGMFCPGANMIGFSTGGTEKMRIDSSGNVLIGGISASGHGFNLEVLNDHAYVKGPDGWNGAGDKAIVALGSAVSNESFGCGYVYGTGLVLSTYKSSGGGHFGSSTQNSLIIADTTGQASFINDVIAYASSDKRLKENIKPLDNALDKINKINGVEFDWIDGKDEHGNSVHGNEGHDVGVIAQEIEEVLPEVVHTRDNGYKAVKYEKIVPLLIEAIKEQQQRINKLEEKLNG